MTTNTRFLGVITVYIIDEKIKKDNI